jgi:hypothetical protein
VFANHGLSNYGFADQVFAQTKNRGQLPGSSPRLTMYKNTVLMYKYTSTRLSRRESFYFGRRRRRFPPFISIFRLHGKKKAVIVGYGNEKKC